MADKRAAKGDTVSVDYTGTLNDGSVFDTSKGKQPIEFTIGSGQVIPGFDTAVTGLKVGETKKVTLQPKEAYGERDENLIQEIPVAKLEEMEVPTAVGTMLQTPGGMTATIVAVDKKTGNAKLDFNFPLAGKALTFELTLRAIK